MSFYKKMQEDSSVHDLTSASNDLVPEVLYIFDFIRLLSVNPESYSESVLCKNK